MQKQYNMHDVQMSRGTRRQRRSRASHVENQRNMVNQANQAHYQNMVHVQTPYSMPQQTPQPVFNTPVPEQPVRHNYNTRNAVSHLAATVPPRHNVWSENRPPVTHSQQAQVQQVSAPPVPVERPVHKHRKQDTVQSKFSLTNCECEFLTLLRSKNIDVSKLTVDKNNRIIEREEISSDHEDDAANGNTTVALRSDTYHRIVDSSDAFKAHLMNYSRNMYNLGMAKAIQLHAMQSNLTMNRFPALPNQFPFL